MNKLDLHSFHDFKTETEKVKKLNSFSALIAVENRQLARTIADYLVSVGVGTVHMVRSCQEARELIEQKAYTLAYVDYALPVMGGPDFVRFIRTSGNHSEESLVTMLIAAARKDEVFQSRDAGSNEIITLPIATKHLVSRLNHMLENPRPMVRANTYVGPCRRRKRVDVAPEKDRRNN